jgi:hypothetical protein
MTATTEARPGFLSDVIDQRGRQDEATQRSEFAQALESFIDKIPLKAKMKAGTQASENSAQTLTHRGELFTLKAHCVSEQLLEWPGVRVGQLVHYAQGVDRPNADEFAMLCRVLGFQQGKVNELFHGIYSDFRGQNPPQVAPIILTEGEQKTLMRQALDQFMADHTSVAPKPRVKWAEPNDGPKQPSEPKATVMAPETPPQSVKIDKLVADQLTPIERLGLQLQKGEIKTTEFYQQVRSLNGQEIDDLAIKTGLPVEKLEQLEKDPKFQMAPFRTRIYAQILKVPEHILLQAHDAQLRA